MTVKELIEALQLLPPESKVYANIDDYPAVTGIGLVTKMEWEEYPPPFFDNDVVILDLG